MRRFLQLIVLLELGAWSLELFGAPLHPANPYPADLAINVPPNADLTWTPGDTELIRNGGFESGNFTGWTRVNNGQGPNNNTYITDGTRIPFNQDAPYPPYAGSYSAVTDQDGPGLIGMYQDVFVPGGAASVWLTWADQIHNFFDSFVPDPPNPQVYRVELRSTNDAVLRVIYRTEAEDPTWTGWNKRAFDLTPYKGQNLRIAFLQEQWRFFFHMFYDNISVRVRSTGPVTYDVFFGTNAVPTSNDFRGTVSSGSWTLPQLLPQRTYFWRVNSRIGTDVFNGPVWRFTTAPVGPLDHFALGPIASPQLSGVPVNVSLGARDAADNSITNLATTVTLSAHMVETLSTNSLQGEVLPSVFVTHENATVGYSFTPSADLLALGFRSQPVGKVSLWTDEGIRLGDPPVQLFAGRSYRLGLYSAGLTTNYLRFDGFSTFAHGTLNQAYEGTGDAFPTRPHPARWWLVDLIYAVPGLSAPIVSGPVSLSGGSWGGSITIPSPGLVELRASDNSGHAGIANLFTVAENFRLDIIRNPAGELLLRFPTVAGRQYAIETSTTLAPNSWSPLGATISGTGNVIEWSVSAADAQRFFRLQKTP
jgi:hypothetical protein